MSSKESTNKNAKSGTRRGNEVKDHSGSAKVGGNISSSAGNTSGPGRDFINGNRGGDGGHSLGPNGTAGPGGPGTGNITINHGRKIGDKDSHRSGFAEAGDNISRNAGNTSGLGRDYINGNRGGDGGHSHGPNGIAGPGGPGTGNITINHGRKIGDKDSHRSGFTEAGDNISSGARNRSGPVRDIITGHRGGDGGHSTKTGGFAGSGGPGEGDITIYDGPAKGCSCSRWFVKTPFLSGFFSGLRSLVIEGFIQAPQETL